MKNRIFLGGTCANSTWRTALSALLASSNVEFFNPVVADWTPECQTIEENEKENKCNIHLYVITKEMQGVFSIAEVVDSCFQAGKIVIFQVLPEGFEGHELKSLKATVNKVRQRGGIAFIDNDLNRLASLIDNAFKD